MSEVYTMFVEAYTGIKLLSAPPVYCRRPMLVKEGNFLHERKTWLIKFSLF